jgi:hydroxypyruvate isomerase
MNVSLSMWSVHHYLYNGSMSMVDFIDFTSKTDAAGVELLDIFWKNQEEELPLVDEALRKHGLQVACYAASNNFVSHDENYRKEQLQSLLDAVDMAVHFGTPIVRVFSGNVDPSVSYEEGMGYIIEGLKNACHYAEKNGIFLCLENHGQFAGKSEQVLDIIEKVASPSLKSTFDAGNFLLVGQNPNEAILHIKDVVNHVHIKDFLKVDGPGDQVLPSLTGEHYLGKVAGDGEVDLPFILQELTNSGYTGWYTVEFEGREEQKSGSIQAINYTKKLLREIELQAQNS